MAEISAKIVKKLRDDTGAPVMEVKKALLYSNGDEKRAKEIIAERGQERAEKRSGRDTGQGCIETYVHADGKIGSMIHLGCETDFVAKTDEFKNLARELAMQVAAMNPKDVEEALEQEYIRDSSKKVGDLIAEVAAKTGENIRLQKVSRFALGD